MRSKVAKQTNLDEEASNLLQIIHLPNTLTFTQQCPEHVVPPFSPTGLLDTKALPLT